MIRLIWPSRATPEKRTYYRLLAAQILALISTGVATIALAFLAYNLAGEEAGAVLGTALAIKMLAYVTITPFASAIAERLPRRSTLVVLDLVRAAIAFVLPFVTQVWEIYVLIFAFQAASAMFNPVFQAVIPDLLEDRGDYTRALSLSRLAVEIETLASPVLAAALLLVVSFFGLFVGTVIGFLISAAILMRVAFPQAVRDVHRGVVEGALLGVRIFLATPRLRALMALNMAAAAATAMVVVNTVVIAQAELGLSERATAVALAIYGVGSVLGALTMPKLLEAINDRTVMLAGASLVAAGLLAGIVVGGYALLAALWFVLGLGGALAQTPAGTLICRSSGDDDRQSLYAAQFALSNACLLVTYPLAGWLGAEAGIPAAFVALGVIAAAAVMAAAMLWPHGDRMALEADVTTAR